MKVKFLNKLEPDAPAILTLIKTTQLFKKIRITALLDRPYTFIKSPFSFLFFLPLFLLNPLSTTAQLSGFNNSFCTDTIINGQLQFQDGYTIEKVNHISTADNGMLVFAAIKNSVHQRSRVIKLNKQNLIEWTSDFYDVQPGSRLSIQQATSIDNKTILPAFYNSRTNRSHPPSF